MLHIVKIDSLAHRLIAATIASVAIVAASYMVAMVFVLYFILTALSNVTSVIVSGLLLFFR